MHKQNVDSEVKQARSLFPWLAIAIVIMVMLAKHVLQHNEGAAFLWEPYLMFANFTAFVFGVGFLLSREKKNA